MTNHSEHNHPNTKAARAACRKFQMTRQERIEIIADAPGVSREDAAIQDLFFPGLASFLKSHREWKDSQS